MHVWKRVPEEDMQVVEKWSIDRVDVWQRKGMKFMHGKNRWGTQDRWRDEVYRKKKR